MIDIGDAGSSVEKMKAIVEDIRDAGPRREEERPRSGKGVTRSSNSYFRDMATLYKQVHVNVQLYVLMQDPVSFPNDRLAWHQFWLERRPPLLKRDLLISYVVWLPFLQRSIFILF